MSMGGVAGGGVIGRLLRRRSRRSRRSRGYGDEACHFGA